MMCKILLSINPVHVENIFNGTKEYEFRKVKCKKIVDTIIIYSTAPIMRVVGEAKVEKILVDTPEMIWEETKHKAGIDADFYYNYYVGKQNAYAYKLGIVTKYDFPKKLSFFNIKSAPQSFIYLSN